MSNKIKLFLCFLTLIAFFSVLIFLNSFESPFPTSSKNLTGSILEAVDTDWDNDGLPNKEESFWNTNPNNPDTDGDGFLDGEEVASGHNPLKPGPDDLLPTPDTLNITDKVSMLMTAGFYAGDLSAKADAATYNKALTFIGEELITDGANALNPKNVPLKAIVFSSDSRKSQENYLNNLGKVIQIDLWGELVNEPRVAASKFIYFYTEDSKNVADSQKYFKSKAEHYEKVIDKINSVPVPPSWLDIHQQITLNLQTLIINHRALNLTPEDPLKGILAMNNLMSVYQDIQPILTIISQKIKENNLNLPDGTLWALVNSLLNDL